MASAKVRFFIIVTHYNTDHEKSYILNSTKSTEAADFLKNLIKDKTVENMSQVRVFRAIEKLVDKDVKISLG